MRKPKRMVKVVTDNIPPDGALRLSGDAAKLLVRLFGEKALQRMNPAAGGDRADPR